MNPDAGLVFDQILTSCIIRHKHVFKLKWPQDFTRLYLYIAHFEAPSQFTELTL